MKKFILQTINIFTNIFYNITKQLKNIRVKLENNVALDNYNPEDFKFIEQVYQRKAKRYSLIFQYDTNTESGINFFKRLWLTLENNPKFSSYKHKHLFVQLSKDGVTPFFTLHRSVFITPKTTFIEYWDTIKAIYGNIWAFYSVSDINYIIVTLWIQEPRKTNNSRSVVKSNNISKDIKLIRKQLGSINTYSTFRKVKVRKPIVIKPMKVSELDNTTILCAFDIETVKVGNSNIHQPILVTFAYLIDGEIKTLHSKVNIKLFKDPNKRSRAIKLMWFELFEQINHLLKGKNLVIYSHNLGSFDGLYLLKPLIEWSKEYAGNVKPLIDQHSKFISILLELINFEEVDDLDNYKITWKFLDSKRVFPISLKELTGIFSPELTKLSDYNPDWNTVDILEDMESEFFDYAIQDSTSLLTAMNNGKINVLWYT